MGEYSASGGDDEQQLDAQRDEIWKALMPTNWCVAVRGFDAARAQDLLDVLNRESVAWHQMRVARERDRTYPGGKLAILGTWGFIDRPEAQRRALLELGYPRESVASADQRAALLASFDHHSERGQYVASATWRFLASPLPVTGLERACDGLLGDSGDWDFLDDWQAAYEFRRDRSVRGKMTRSYYLGSNEASDTPRVCTTFDAVLQRRVGELLDRLIVEHDPAVAMAIAIDVASGDVLAVDSRDRYGIAGFAPLFHEFMPGSTMKVPVMATALESGNVHPDDRFNVGTTRHYKLGSRTINEAESSRTGWLSASECLAYSVNAGLVQIGLKVPSDFFRGRLAALHYGQRPASGLGGERAGLLPPLPWSEVWTHASVSYGYEIMTTLWQHVAALATVVRGGDWLPLRIIDAVEQNGERYELPRAQPEHVFSADTCAKVRTMMQLGAREGTGKKVAGYDKLPDLLVGSKTGTAQKTPGEVCIHEELADQAAHRAHGTVCSKACRARLIGRRTGHSTCYTSSMCIFGRVDGPGHENDREVMVLVVTDDPRKGGHFGADISGPTAVAILKEALGRTHLGDPIVPDVVAGFAPSHERSVRSLDQPWAEVAW
jgi:cell division protein FtsI/penicillin-binding protein 2